MLARYAALEADAHDTYELEDIRQLQQPSQRIDLSHLVMPAKYHRALGRYLRAAAEDSDSSDSEDGHLSKDEKSSSLDTLVMKSKREREQDSEPIGDIEARLQPNWARNPSSSESNVLRRRLVLPTILIMILVLLAAFFAGHSTLNSSTVGSKYAGAKKKVELDDYLHGTFWVDSKSLDWMAEAGDGVYSYRTNDASIMLHDLNTNTTKLLVDSNKVLNDFGIRLDYSTFAVSSDLRYILFGADRDKLWRHSSRSNFWIHDLEHSTTSPLVPKTSPPSTSIATWAPKGHSIALVQHNDLYISTLASAPGTPSNSSIIRITNTGNETIFNGVPDWVYEEEVFSSDSALWWSPDGKKLAFLSFDESEVQVYSYPVYNPGEARPGAKAYPDSVDMRYPKPGTPNPKVSLHLFDLAAYQSGFTVSSATYRLETESPLDVHDRVVTEVAWVGDNDLIVKETNRAASRERVAHFDLAGLGASRPLEAAVITRDVDWSKIDGGWVETGQRIHGIDAFASDSLRAKRQAQDLPEGYLDIIPDKAGYMHLALFSPADAKDPIFLTSGLWEFDDTIRGVDISAGLVYFIAANPAIERHLYSVPLPRRDDLEAYRSGSKTLPPPTNLTDTSVPGFYDASFSPQAGYYLLAQRHGIPWQTIEKAGDPDFGYTISDNKDLREEIAKYAMPKTTFATVQVNNVSINIAETLPPNLDRSGRTKYPVLLRPYGGPVSQTVQDRFKFDWTHVLASEGYIVLEIDGRGTGYMGRSFRSCIRGNLGELEAKDQIDVAEWYQMTHPFADETRMGIQGWSYGGFLTAKVLETNTSAISLGISVAPVTDWRYYDTIYTERYMDTLDVNKAGYAKSAVTDMTGFKNADYLLMHGSGDDNVHYLNSAALLDRLTVAGVRGFRFRMFTDSAHSMGTRGAFGEVYREMAAFLDEKFGGPRRTKHSQEERK